MKKLFFFLAALLGSAMLFAQEVATEATPDNKPAEQKMDYDRRKNTRHFMECSEQHLTKCC